ncbi:tumor necrosis factor receptor superfamily member 5-like isoform X2 [Arapaima gigas]
MAMFTYWLIMKAEPQVRQGVLHMRNIYFQKDILRLKKEMYIMLCVLKVFAVFLLLFTRKVCSECDSSKYEIDGKCCSMCSPGTRVYMHCGENITNGCVPCLRGTFNDKPNGVLRCQKCTTCDEGLGLKMVKECTASSDTVCGVLEGNYCIEPYEGGCRAAEKHTTCKPGQFIKRPGTNSTDAVCENCPEKSYSDGFSTSCTPHTDEDKGLPTVKPEDSGSDSEDENNRQYVFILKITAGVAAVITATLAVICLYLSRRSTFSSDDFLKNKNIEMTNFARTADERGEQTENITLFSETSDPGSPEENGCDETPPEEVSHSEQGTTES